MELTPKTKNSIHKSWFFFMVLYLIVDYGRIQDIIHIGFVRPGILTNLALIYFLISGNGFLLSKSKQSTMIWCFIILTAMLVPFALNNFYAYMTTKNMLMFMPFILSVIVCISSVKYLKKIVWVMIILMFHQSLYSLFHAGMGSGSYFGDENDIALFINLWIPFCYFLFFYEKKKIKKLLYAVSLATGLAAIVASSSRGGFVGLLSVTVVIWFFSPKKLISLLLICIIGIGVYIYSGDTYRTEMSTVTDLNESTARSRIEMWKASWKMFLDSPFGVGGNNFQIRFPEYQADYLTKSMWGHVAHSLWFTLLPELGVFGVFIYCLLIYYNLKDIFSIRKISFGNNSDLKYLHYLSLAFIASLAGFFASGSFLAILYYPHYWYMTALIVATTRISKNCIVNGESAA